MTTIIQDFTPGELSRLISTQHETVSDACDELSVAARMLAEGGALALGRARDLSTLLCDELLAHIAIEEELLVPALRHTDAWGAGRADHLLSRLHRRRREITAFRSILAGMDGVILKGTIDSFIDQRVLAMRRAELRDLNALRDDVIGIDFNGG